MKYGNSANRFPDYSLYKPLAKAIDEITDHVELLALAKKNWRQ